MENKFESASNDIISVIIPYYKGENYIEECLGSIYNQTLKNIEVILINDGSSKEFLENLKNIKYPELILFHQTNKGQSAARNKGVDIAKGKYILFVDCDDKIEKSFLEKTYNVLKSNPKVKICYTKSLLFEKENTEWMLPKFKMEDFLFSNCIPITALFYREDFIKINGFEENLSYFEDWDLWISILEGGGEVYQIEEHLFFYRIRDNESSLTNLSTSQENKISLNRLFIYQKHYDFYEKYGFGFNSITNIVLNRDNFKKKYYNLWYKKLIYRLFKPKKFNQIYSKLNNS
ncbi:glycosyltransferase family 2 protein [Chryseobacterium aquaticum]|uniref:Glycosyltransferase family 2 protein n=1 Tax=Chryseobacterium aquaticum TaxID=452084 RepID=A0A848N7B9_9FLAO|nr:MULTISPECIES: glycosyltransferase family A protein [Chryseobacterium]NMR35374.1 glycosyltransferase family 2 protein [Chryseobacterium aquaticum]NRQ47450.1 glycosyltransferase family 2 protein [Chryseobacterium sp. C-204]